MAEYDIIIVGGGIAGAVAAIGAGRAGAKVLLVEQNGYLGGTLTACGVGPMMTFHAGETQVVRGVTGELVDRLAKKGLSPGHIFDTTGYTYTVTPFDPEGLKIELEQMIMESGGSILYHAVLAKTSTQAGKIAGITVCTKAGLMELTAPVYIDATGDADLSAQSGVGFTYGRPEDGRTQPMSMMLRLSNVDIAATRAYILTHSEDFPRLEGDPSIINKADRLSIGGFTNTLKKARAEGAITFPREDVLFFETNNPGEVIVNISRVLGYDNLDPYSMSLAEIEGRRQAWEVFRLLRNYIPGFAQARMLYTGPNIGVRASRQIKGIYTLTTEDVFACKEFEDSIAYSGYPLDVHSPDGTATKEQSKTHRAENHAYWGKIRSLPYRSLVNPVIGNLITVGRCISVAFKAQGAFRTAPIAGATGHAGGIAAALAARHGIPLPRVNTDELRSLLAEQGAYIQ